MPKISLVVPIYKVETYLRECLNSLIEQTFQDIEIILVDDGSPDHCGRICDEYAAKDSRIRVVHKKNQGVSVARNVGLSMAQGEWITFVDADDWVERSLCEIAYSEVIKHGAEVLIWDFDRYFLDRVLKRQAFTESPLVREKDEKILFQQDIFTDVYDDKIVKGKNVVLSGVWCCLYKKSLILENGIQFAEGVSIYEDALFNLRVFEHAERIAYINKYLSHHRQWSNSASYAYRSDWLKLSELIIKEYKKFKPLDESIQKHQESYKEIADIIKCNCLIGIITRYLFHEHNTENLDDRMRLLESILMDNDTRGALKRINLKHFNPQRKILLILARYRLVGCLRLLYKTKSLRNNFQRENTGG